MLWPYKQCYKFLVYVTLKIQIQFRSETSFLVFLNSPISFFDTFFHCFITFSAYKGYNIKNIMFWFLIIPFLYLSLLKLNFLLLTISKKLLSCSSSKWKIFRTISTHFLHKIRWSCTRSTPCDLIKIKNLKLHSCC